MRPQKKGRASHSSRQMASTTDEIVNVEKPVHERESMSESRKPFFPAEFAKLSVRTKATKRALWTGAGESGAGAGRELGRK